MQQIRLSRIVSLLSAATLVLAGCNHDNCYRALARHSVSASAFCATYTKSIVTATTALPTYASPCSSIPSKVTSACTCVFTTTTVPTPSPSPIINSTYRNGDFNQAPYGPSEVNDSEPPWFTTRAINATIKYVEQGLNGVATFYMVGQPYGAPGSQAQIKNPITVYQQTNYKISFYFSQTSPDKQNCVLEIGWNDSNYAVLEPSQITDDTTLYGPTEFESTYLGPTPDNPDGTFNTDLSVYVSCFGIKGVAPANVAFQIFGITINPA